MFAVVILASSCGSDTKTSYYETGEKMFEVPLKEGKYHGIYKQYYPSGTLSAEVASVYVHRGMGNTVTAAQCGLYSLQVVRLNLA